MEFNMPLVTIQQDCRSAHRPFRDENIEELIRFRDTVHHSVAQHLKVELGEVEIRVRDTGLLDVNCAPIGVEIDTGSGKDSWRKEARVALAQAIAKDIHDSRIIPKKYLRSDGCYVWIRIVESAFVPIGFPRLAR
jgi:hypothetical protein